MGPGPARYRRTQASQGRAGHACALAQGVLTIRTPTHPARLDLPDARIDARVARDIDLALFGLLPAGHLLGGAVPQGQPDAATEKSSSSAGGSGPVVAVEVPPAVAATAREHGGLVLRDEELTPLARLELDAEPDAADRSEAGAVAETVRLQGTLVRVRERESGPGRREAVAASDLWPSTRRTVVVFGRPPVDADTAALDYALAGDDGLVDPQARRSVLAVVSDDPASPVPTQVMAEVVRLWFDDLELTDATVVTAPLAWRDAESNAALATRLGSALGASPTVFIDADDGSHAANCWRDIWARLEAGRPGGDSHPEISPRIADRLRRWRRPRAERGLVLMFSGLSGSGKSTLARDVSGWITANSERTVSLLDGDVVRTMLSSGLGFSKADRELNIRRIGYVGAEIARHGGIAICAPIAPYAATREAVRGMVRAVGDFALVHVSTPLEACEARDLKGLYAKARAGLIPEFTGVSDPYEVPTDAALAVDTSLLSRAESVQLVVDLLRSQGWVRPTEAEPSQNPTASP